MIAKIRVLGLRGADARAVRAAAGRIRDYLEGAGADQDRLSGPASAPTLDGLGPAPTTADDSHPLAPLTGLSAYYEAGPDGRSRGRARGAGAHTLGLAGAVDGDQLVAALIGRHPVSGAALIGPRGSSGRSADAPKGSRPVPRGGPADELLTIPEASFLIGVHPQYLRRLAERRPRTRFDHPTTSDRIDPRVGGRLIAAMTGAPVSVAHSAGQKDYLLADKDANSGEWRVRRGEVERFMAERVMPETVIGFDLVCAAPKSVSLLWAVGDQEVRKAVAEAMDEAVDAVVSYLEDHACFGMVDGRNRHGDGLAAVSYVHDVSRSLDAHLHVHNLIPNLVRVPVLDDDGRPMTGPDGQPRVEWRTLDSGALLRHVKTAGFLGGAQLRNSLARRLGAPWNAPRNGVAEIAGFPSDLLRSQSGRHDQVMEGFVQLVEAGYEPDAATEDAAQRRSRPPKTLLGAADMRAVQAEKLAAVGWSPERVLGLIDGAPRTPEPVTEVDMADLADLLAGPSGLTAKQNVFTTREVHQAVAQWAGDRLSATEIRALAEGFLADPRVVLCGVSERARTRQDPEPTFTTEGLLASEDNLQTLYREGRVDHGAEPAAVVSGPLVDDAMAAADARLRAERGDPAARLSEEQRDFLRDVTGSGDRVRCCHGPAGTGKNEVLWAAAVAWRAAGHNVVGSANGGSQTEELGRRLEVESQVVRAWLTRLEGAEDPHDVWPTGTIVVIDEATQVDTRDAERLARWAHRADAVLVFVGDPAQLGSVGAGGWFRHIVYAHGAPRLSTVYRQAGAEMAEVRAALSGLRSEMPKRVRAAMDRLAADGRIQVYEDAEALLSQVTDDWYADRLERLAAEGGPRPPKPSRTMAGHLREVDTLNARARARLIADGTVTGPELVVGDRRFAVGDEVITLTQADHTLVPFGAPRDRYVRTGTVGRVTAVRLDPLRPERQRLVVEFPGRGSVPVDWNYLTHEFEDGRTGGLAHAYAVTADRSQGANMHAGRPVATEATSRAAFYVMASRGEKEVAAYLIRDRDLETNLDDERWLPTLRQPGGPFEAVVERLERSRSERLATDLDPLAWDAQRLRRGRSLAELAAVRRSSEAEPEPAEPGAGARFAVARRAEMAEEAAVGARAVSRPDAAVAARLGPRPAGGEAQRAWDAAVRAAASYRARWEADPGSPGYSAGPAWAVGPRPADEPSSWATQRAEAEAVVSRWAADLDPFHHRRFWAVIERIPRERATAGVHALLAAGLSADHIYGALSDRERGSVRAGAAILEYRVKDLLTFRHIDDAAFRLAPPLTAAAEWDRAGRLLLTAEAQHLSNAPVAVLAAERSQLARLLSGTASGDEADRLRADVAAAQLDRDAVSDRLAAAVRNFDDEAGRRRPDRGRLRNLQAQVETWRQRRADHDHRVVVLTDRLNGATGPADTHEGLRERHRLLTEALDLMVDRAVASVADQPPAYLVELLGVRPSVGDAADAWDGRARAVEAWRHHTMGLAYGEPGAPSHALASERALGPVPDDPTLAAVRARLLDESQVTLDLGVVV